MVDPFLSLLVFFVLLILVLIVVRVIPSKAIAFVTYKLRLCAEFAKEAMADQSLGSKNEVPSIRAISINLK
jgi:hypothetical protein